MVNNELSEVGPGTWGLMIWGAACLAGGSVSLESKTCAIGETTSHMGGGGCGGHVLSSPVVALTSLPLNSLTPGPLGLFPKGFRVCIAGMVTVSCMVSCGQASVQSSRAVAFMASSGTWTPARMGPFPRWCVCSGLTVFLNVQYPPCPCPVTEPCSPGGVGLCVCGLFLERKWSLGGTGCGCHC